MTGFLSEELSATFGAVYVGDSDDTDFSTFTRVTLDDFWLANLAVSYRIFEDVELFGRVENMFDQKYEQVVGFGVAGAAGYVGASVSF